MKAHSASRQNIAAMFEPQLAGGNTTIRFPQIEVPPVDPGDIGRAAAG